MGDLERSSLGAVGAGAGGLLVAVVPPVAIATAVPPPASTSAVPPTRINLRDQCILFLLWIVDRRAAPSAFGGF